MEQTPDIISKHYSQAPTIVTKGSRLTGELLINGKLHIDGEVSGSLYVSSEISVGETGILSCDYIRSQTIVISGRVCSTIYADLVEIIAGGFFEGHLHCKKLAIESGSIVIAQCRYTPFPDEKRFAKQLATINEE